MTEEEQKKFETAIKNVCHTYGVVLIGTCNYESIYGEISVAKDGTLTVRDKENSFNFDYDFFEGT